MDADERFIKAIAHPLRRRILTALNERVASPSELAAEFGEPLGRLSHHVRTLVELGAIRLERTEPRRGAVEHFYRAVTRAWFTDDLWQRLPASTRRSIFGEYLQRIVHDVGKAAEHGFEHSQAHVSYTLLALDEQGMDEVAALLVETLERAVAIQGESERRRGGAPAELATELVILHFEPRGDG